MQCQHCKNLLHALHDGEIDALPEIARQHLKQCRDCAALQDDLQRLREMLQALPVEELDAQARQKLISSVARRIRGRGWRAKPAWSLPDVRWRRLVPALAGAAAILLLLLRLNTTPETADEQVLISEQEFYLQEHIAEDESAFSDDVFTTVVVSIR